MSYERLSNKTLVTVQRGRGRTGSLRIAEVTDSDLVPVGEPGIGRVRYYVEPATIREGRVSRLFQFHGLWVKATQVTQVTAEQAAELIDSNQVQEWTCPK